ncbi:hypothetical protein JQN58_05565 [Aneurinibacillus sp. BA2021]|nr:hypothetical protein [Aneurinibacillus sp. BA2021]
MKRSFWMGAAVMVTLGLVRMMRLKPSRADRAVRLGKRLLYKVGFTRMRKLPVRYMVNFGSQMLRRMAR